MPTPDFILHLRERIGHDELWLTGVTAVVVRGPRPAVRGDSGERDVGEGNGGQRPEVLLVRSADTGRWGPVTGILEPGEAPVDAVVREVAEETGVQSRVVRLSSVLPGDHVLYPNGDRARFLNLTFRCEAVTTDARVADAENTDVVWAPLPSLALPSIPGRDVPEHLLDRIRTALQPRLQPRLR